MDKLSTEGSRMVNATATALIVCPVVPTQVADEIVQSFAQIFDVEVQRTDMPTEPGAWGMSEIATVLGFITDAKEIAGWLLFFASGDPKAKKLRESLQNLLRKANRSPDSGRRYIPCGLEVGAAPEHPSVRFYFHGQRSPEELAQQLREAARVIEALLVEILSASPGPQEYGYFWDSQSQEWRGRLYALENPETTETMWWPSDLQIG